MAIMLSNEQNHQHALTTLQIIDRYQDFVDNIYTVADMGCGIGRDAAWWANLSRQDGTPRNIKVNAIDRIIDPNVIKNPNISYMNVDFSATTLPSNSQDFVWAHDSLQYSLSPLQTLLHWWDIMQADAMLLITLPYNFSVNTHRDILKVDTAYQFNSYFNWTLGTLIMSLAATGFDCRDGHFRFDKENGWIQAAVYKLPKQPDPRMSWYDMCEQKLLPPSIENSIMRNGNFNEVDIVGHWIDRTQYILAS